MLARTCFVRSVIRTAPIMSDSKTILYYRCPNCGDEVFMFYPPDLKCEKCGSKMEKSSKPFRPRVIAVDFDGTLCENKWPAIGAPNKDLIYELKIRQRRGEKIILWTCRMGERLDAAIEWCKKQGLDFDAVNENLPEIVELFGGDSRKIFADEYIDDKMFGIEYELPYKEDVSGKKDKRNN